MQQGKSRKKQMEARRRFFASQAARGGQAPAAPPPAGTVHAPQAQPPPGTRPGEVGSTPPPQIQSHQARTTTGIGTQPAPGQPVFAAQSGQQVAVTPGPRTGLAPAPRLPQTGQVPAQPQGEVTVVLYSSGSSAQLLSQQLQAIRRQTVQPAEIHVHVDGVHGHDEQSLMRMSAVCRTPQPMGRHFRLALAREAKTPYVLVLEEDVLPGPRWLERALEAIKAGDAEDLPFGPAVVACSGVLQGAPDPAAAHPVGPELPRNEEPIVVDYGRGGWLFATEMARIAESMPRVGSSSGSLGILLAAAAQQAGLPTVVMDYGISQEHWGSTTPQQHGVDPHDAAHAFSTYVEMGWEPEYLGKGLPPVPAQEAAPQQHGHGHLPPQATPREPKVTRMGGITTIERVLEPHERTPDPSNNEQIVPDSPPPVSARTERVVASSPPPESAKTERIVASEPPKSQTGR